MDIAMSEQRRRPCVAHPLFLLAIAAVTILVGACQPFVTPSNQATDTVVPATSSPADTTLIEGDGTLRPGDPAGSITPPALEASTVIALSILDAWTGLSPAAPIEAYFELKPDAAAFWGRAELSVAGYTTPITKTVAISVPVSIVDEFLTLIANTPLEEGDYQPAMSHTDDYPMIGVTIETANDEVVFGSESQGPSHVPWRVVVNQKPYITHADTFARAMALLDPYLARAEMAELVEQAMQRDTEE